MASLVIKELIDSCNGKKVATSCELNPLIAVLFQRNLASKKKKFVGLEHGTRDCKLNALPTWLLQHTGVQCNI